MAFTSTSGGVYNPTENPNFKKPTQQPGAGTGQYTPGNFNTPFGQTAVGQIAGSSGMKEPMYQYLSRDNPTGGADQPNGINWKPPTGGAQLFSGPHTGTSVPPAAAAPAEGPLSGPGYYEEFYKAHGNDLMTPSASEDLYSRGVEGSNPYYDYAEQRATDSINAASRARGGFNSGAALAQIGNSSAFLRGEQAHELGQLAGQADQGRIGRYGLTGQMADTAQGRMEGRITGGIDREMALAGDEAKLAGGFYGKAGDLTQQANLEAIRAKLSASGMDAAEVKQYMDMLSSAASTAIKAA
jgi:hypothetical protein